MKRLLVTATTSILAIGLLAGCAGGIETYTDADKTINANVNEEFVITLDSNPTTGYNWEEDYDEAMLKLVESKYEMSKQAEEGMVGAGGTQYFRFQALKTGKTEITLTYKRSWETESADQKVFTVDIQ